jgi:hypothetical protein
MFRPVVYQLRSRQLPIEHEIRHTHRDLDVFSAPFTMVSSYSAIRNDPLT